jgi:hypothetical protein
MIATGALLRYPNGTLIPLHVRNAVDGFLYFIFQMMKPTDTIMTRPAA